MGRNSVIHSSRLNGKCCSVCRCLAALGMMRVGAPREPAPCCCPLLMWPVPFAPRPLSGWHHAAPSPSLSFPYVRGVSHNPPRLQGRPTPAPSFHVRPETWAPVLVFLPGSWFHLSPPLKWRESSNRSGCAENSSHTSVWPEVQVEPSGAGEGLAVCVSRKSQVREAWLFSPPPPGLKNPLRSRSWSGVCEGFRLERSLDCKGKLLATQELGECALANGRGFLASEAPVEDSLGSG